MSVRCPLCGKEFKDGRGLAGHLRIHHLQVVPTKSQRIKAKIDALEKENRELKQRIVELEEKNRELTEKLESYSRKKKEGRDV